MSVQKDIRVVELRFQGSWPELEILASKFDSVRSTEKHIHSVGEPGASYLGGPPAELIVLIVSATANILTIADILSKRLNAKGNSVMRVGNKEIELKG